MSEVARYPLHPNESPRQFLASLAVLYADRSGSSFPSAVRLPIPPVPGTVLRFIGWTHLKENQQEVVPFTEGCDILALEGVVEARPTNRKEMKSFEYDLQLQGAQISALVSGVCDRRTARRLKRHDVPIVSYIEQGKEKRAEVLTELLERVDGGVATSILLASMDKVERVVRVDVGVQESQQHLLLKEKTDQARVKLKETILSAGVDWDDLRQLGLKYAGSATNEWYFRESTTARQLELLAAANPDKTIGMIGGLSHHMMTRLIHAPVDSMQRFLVSEPEANRTVHERSVNAYYHLVDGMQGGYYTDQMVDKFLASFVALYVGGPNSMEGISRMDSRQYDDFTQQLKSLWSTRILASDPDSEDAIYARHEATEQLVVNYSR